MASGKAKEKMESRFDRGYEALCIGEHMAQNFQLWKVVITFPIPV